MTLVPRIGIVLSFIVLLAAAAGATTVRPKAVTCPVCEEKITVLSVSSSNSFGGPDYDLCSHAAGESPRSFGIWTCPHCLYSRYGGEFEESPEADISKRIRDEQLKSPVEIPKTAGQRAIPVWVKYRLYATIREWEGASSTQLAMQYRAAAWATRCEGGRALRPVWDDPKLGGRCRALSEAERKRTEELETERPGETFFRCRVTLATADRHLEAAMSKEATPVDAMLRRLLAAKQFRYRGENLRALRALESLGKTADLPPSVRQATQSLRNSIEKEREFQEAWLGHFARIVEEGLVKGDELAIYGYVAGDNLRRLGRVEEAAQWIRRALKSGQGPAWLTGAATEALSRMGVEGPSEEELEEVRKRRVQGAIARLNDPATASDADHELRRLQATEALPGIVAALDHEHPRVRSAAALTLGFQPEPSDAAIDRLGRVLLEDDEREPRWRAAVSLSRIGDPRSRLVLEKSLVKENDDWILRSVIEALGFVGEKESLPILLKAYYVESREVELALTRIANRVVPEELNTKGELLDWWAKHRPGDRKDWVRAGFEEAGIELKAPWSRESVPQLLKLLEDERHWIRCNAVRILREISGLRLPWEGIANTATYPRAREERKSEASRWREWWAEERKKGPSEEK
ncbi:MAG: DUF2225 domain-containing protein [Planctomycetota bacterium]